MENEIEILIFGENSLKGQKHKVPCESALIGVVEKFTEGGISVTEIAIFDEDGDELLEVTEIAGRPHHGKNRIIHCHRCKHVKVHVFYNGEASLEVRPSRRIHKIQEWAINHFKVDKHRRWCLRLEVDGEALQEDIHVGSLTSYPECSVKLYLTEFHKPQG